MRHAQGLDTISQVTSNSDLNEHDAQNLYQLFILLYVDDTVLCSESKKNFQTLLNAMSEYCTRWNIFVNIKKTKVVVFSRGKIRKKPQFVFNCTNVDVVYDMPYLGVTFNYNNRYTIAQKALYDKANRAMFALLRRSRQLALPIDLQIELFDKMIVPILLYGCEIWRFNYSEMATKLQLKYYRIELKVKKKLTPKVLIYGKLGKFPLEVY